MTATDQTRDHDQNHGAGPVVPTEFETAAASVDAALLRAAELDDDGRAAVEAVKVAIEAFHRPALTHIVRRLREDRRGKELLFELVDDPAVRAVFGLHGLIRTDPATRARQALDDIRPYLRSHGGDVELVGIDGTEAIVRLHGSCGGCSMSAVTLREVVSEAVLARVDEVTAVRVADDEPTAVFIPLEAIGTNRDTGWRRACHVDEVVADRPLRIDIDNTDEFNGHRGGERASLVAVRIDQGIAVFRNECPHQGRPLDTGICVDGELKCASHGFSFDIATGDCLSAPGAQLTQVPTRIDNGEVWVRCR